MKLQSEAIVRLTVSSVEHINRVFVWQIDEFISRSSKASCCLYNSAAILASNTSVVYLVLHKYVSTSFDLCSLSYKDSVCSSLTVGVLSLITSLLLSFIWHYSFVFLRLVVYFLVTLFFEVNSCIYLVELWYYHMLPQLINSQCTGRGKWLKYIH